MWRHGLTWIVTGLIALAVTLALAFIGGAEYAQGSGARPAGKDSLLIDDFEDRDAVAVSGSAWIGLADDLFGGASTVELEPVAGGAHGSRGALRIHGKVSPAPGAIVSAWTPVLEGARAADVSRLQGIRMKVRGSGDILIGVHGGPDTRMTNFMGRATASGSWSTVTILFKDFSPRGKGRENEVWTPHHARYVGVSNVPGAQGAFDVTIDDVAWIGAKGAGTPTAEPGTSRFARALSPDDPSPLRDLPWASLASDPAGDGTSGLPDARALFVARDRSRPLVWFRIDLEGEVPAPWIGVNLALDVDGDHANGTAWWGTNSAFHLDRLVSAWVFRVGSRWEGSVGIVTAADAAAFRITNDREVHLAIDRAGRRVYLGVPASELTGKSTRALAAVGSAMVRSDDVPDAGAAELGAVLARP